MDLLEIWTKAIRGTRYETDRPHFGLDPVLYAELHRDVSESEYELEFHYDEFGRAEGRIATRYQLTVSTTPDLDACVRSLIIDPEIRDALNAEVPGAAELAFELIALGEPFDRNCSDFSAIYYRRLYRDVAEAGIDPFLHYVRFGMKEGRRSLSALRQNRLDGKRKFDPHRPTCLICTHEFSNTGAPVVASRMVQSAARTHNVVVASRFIGPLMEVFREAAVLVLVSATPAEDFLYFENDVTRAISFAILNSVESQVYVKYLVSRGVSFAAYIHEYSDYTWPAYKMYFMALYADALIFSSEAVRNSWTSVFADVMFDVASDSHILPQEVARVGTVSDGEYRAARTRLSEVLGVDCTGRRIIYGAGRVQLRKGTDLFVMVADDCRERDPTALYVWIGDGFNVEDVNFGVWLGKHMREAGVDKPNSNIYFIPEGPCYDDVCRAADILFLPSRLDPLPNVVFDALRFGCQVVLFENASGFDDPSYRALDALCRVRYGDLSAAAEALIAAPLKRRRAAFSRPAATRGGSVTPGLGKGLRALFHRRPMATPLSPPTEAQGSGECHETFERIEAFLRTRLASRAAAHDGRGAYDVSILFGNGEVDEGNRIRERSKIWTYGRSAIWRESAEARSTISASKHWVHRRVHVEDHTESPATSLPDYNIHLHAFYVDGIDADLDGHAVYRSARRVVVTTDTDEKAGQIRKATAAAGIDGEVRVVPNKGRDILPFLTLFDTAQPPPANEIWCHVHQKRSIGTAVTGDVWRQFLMRILLGHNGQISSAVSTIARREVGLVTALDPYIVGWAASSRLLPTLTPKLRRALPSHPLVFPVGSMFWTKAGVVARMNALFEQSYPWPNEPISSDGTVFHLIERLWPTAAGLASLDSVFLSNPMVRRT